MISWCHSKVWPIECCIHGNNYFKDFMERRDNATHNSFLYEIMADCLIFYNFLLMSDTSKGAFRWERDQRWLGLNIDCLSPLGQSVSRTHSNYDASVVFTSSSTFTNKLLGMTLMMIRTSIWNYKLSMESTISPSLSMMGQSRHYYWVTRAVLRQWRHSPSQ